MLSQREPPKDDNDDPFTNEAPSSFSALEDDVDLSIIWGKETPEDIERRKARDAQKQQLQKRVDREQAIVAQLGRLVKLPVTIRYILYCLCNCLTDETLRCRNWYHKTRVPQTC
jgi:hypothetical protein